MTDLPKYQRAAAFVAAQIAEGALMPGAPAPSGAALARLTGYSTLTCRRALRVLIRDGVLAPGASRNARSRVPSPHSTDQPLATVRRELSTALANHRRAAGLTQSQLAEVIGLSVTTIGHAETGRLWQSRTFWELTDKVLTASGDLLRLYDAYRAAEVSADLADASDSTDTIEAPLASAESPVPVSLQIVWSDGAITGAPWPVRLQRETSSQVSETPAPKHSSLTMNNGAEFHHGPISADCPVECLRGSVSLHALGRLIYAYNAPLTVGDVVKLCAGGELDDIRGLGPQRISEIRAALILAGFDIPQHPHDG